MSVTTDPRTTAGILVVWTVAEAPLAVMAALSAGPAPASIVSAVLVALIVLLTVHAVPALLGGKM